MTSVQLRPLDEFGRLDMAIRGILFDKDGTLLDFNATWVPINRMVALVVANGDEALAGRLLEVGGQDDATGIVKPGSLLAASNTREIATAWAKLTPDHGHPDLVEVMDEIFQREGAMTAVPVDGLADTIRNLKARGLKLGIATSDSEAGARATLAPFDILSHFDFVAGYDSGFGHKPAPGMVLGFCKTSGLAPEEVLVVGDNSHDLEMGRAANAGMVVGVLSGTSGSAELEPLADGVIKDIGGLEGVLGLAEGVNLP